MRVGLLACDEVAERFQHVAGTYTDMFTQLLAPHIPGMELVRYEAREGRLPSAPDACDAWITTGSRASVYDDEPWIRATAGFIREVADAGRPFVGICFGHQLLAQALGGEVKRAPGGWGAGVLPMEVLSTEPWMQPPRDVVRMQYMHADQVTRAPAGAEVTGAAPHCPVAMFRAGERLLGIEGHPEFPAAYARALIEDRRARIGEGAARDALARVDAPMDTPVLGAWIARFMA